MKTLVIKYLPAGDRSKTKQLMDHLVENIEKDSFEIVDLLEKGVPYFNIESYGAYVKRNFMRVPQLEDNEVKELAPYDQFVSKVKNADLIVFVYPMYNYSMPGIVKSFYDAIMLNGELFEVTASGFPKGLLSGKRALTLYTSGGDYYAHEKMNRLDNVATLTSLLNEHMGIKDYELVCAVTGRQYDTEKSMNEAKQKIDLFMNKGN